MGDAGTDIRERRYELFFPRSLSLLTRTGLWLRGYFDAWRGKVIVSRRGFVTSPYCKTLVNTADLRINAEWQESTGLMFELRPGLENAVRERDEIRRRIEELPTLKAAKVAAARIDYAGDAQVSEHLAEKRRQRRAALVEFEFSEREARLREALNRTSASVGPILANYQDVRDASVTHERLVRMDYLARLSCYCRGASRKIRINPKFINDSALTTRPRDENDEFFARWMASALNDPEAEAAEKDQNSREDSHDD